MVFHRQTVNFIAPFKLIVFARIIAGVSIPKRNILIRVPALASLMNNDNRKPACLSFHTLLISNKFDKVHKMKVCENRVKDVEYSAMMVVPTNRLYQTIVLLLSSQTFILSLHFFD